MYDTSLSLLTENPTMQLNDAINLVRDKFMAETQGQSGGDIADKYQDAFADYPVLMEVATQIFGVQIINQNIQQQMAQQQDQQPSSPILTGEGPIQPA